MAVQIPGSGSGSGGAGAEVYSGNPHGTDWIVGFDEFTSDELRISSGSYMFGPLWYDSLITGSGTSRQLNGPFTGSIGTSEEKINATAGAVLVHRTKSMSSTFADATYRVGVRVRIPTIPVSGGEDFLWRCGFSDHTSVLTSGTSYAGIGFDLTDSTTNFVVNTKDGTTENVTDTGVAMVIDTWYNIEIECSPTTVSAWIDGTIVLDASTTNHPLGATACGMMWSSFFRAGTPAAYAYLHFDWAYMAYKPTVSRGTAGTGSPWG